MRPVLLYLIYSQSAVSNLINLCEEKYYSQKIDDTAQLKDIGCQLYAWLDGKEGWLRKALGETNDRTTYLDLIQNRLHLESLAAMGEADIVGLYSNA